MKHIFLLSLLAILLLPVGATAQTNSLVVPPVVSITGAVMVQASAVNGGGIANSNITLLPGKCVQWASSGTTADAFVCEDAANALIQRNSTNAQSFSVCNTWTDASNFECGQFAWSGNRFFVQAANTGSGTARSMSLRSGTGTITLGATGTAAVQLGATQTTVPTCTTNCGTPGNVCTGTDTFMICTMGTTPASGMQVNFNGTWPAAPACIVQMALAGMVVGKQVLTAATTTTTITLVTNGTAPVAGDKYAIQCGGVQ
jgi:hypothetical protein